MTHTHHIPQAATQVLKLYILLCGYEILKKSDSTRGRDERFMLAVPISAYLLETTDGFILVDSGLNTDILNSADLRHQYYTSRGWTPPIAQPEHELLHQLAQIGIRPQDVGRVILTHMHMDHTGGLKHFQHAAITVQRNEHSYAFQPDHDPSWFDVDYDMPGLHWNLIDGDTEVIPGVRCIATTGHTVGHQSVVVNLPQTGTVVLVGDVADLMENFRDEVLPGIASDDTAALDSIRRVNDLASTRQARLFLCHDPDFVHHAKLAPDYYE